MLNRRSLLFGASALLLSRSAYSAENPFKLDPQYKRQGVVFPGYAMGTIVVDPENFFLYYVGGPGVAIRYGVGVGRAGLAFKGQAIVGRKEEWPRWRPTDNMISRSPEKFARFSQGRARWPRQSAGRASALPLSRRTGHHVPHPRDERALVDRSSRFQRLHSHDQRPHHRPLRPRLGRNAGHGALSWSTLLRTILNRQRAGIDPCPIASSSATCIGMIAHRHSGL